MDAAAGAPVSVAVVQGAIPQDEKWQSTTASDHVDLYQQLNEQALGAQLIVWPEAASRTRQRDRATTWRDI